MLNNDAWQRSDYCGPRPMVPSRDLAQVAQLIERGYGQRLSRRARTALFGFKILRHLGPFLWLLGRFSSEFREFCSAFVWVEDGHVVGVVASHQIGATPRHWIQKNAAVQKSYRGRGIARALAQAMNDETLARGGETVIAMVLANNETALRSIQSVGFRPVAAFTEMRLATVEPTTLIVLPGVSLRRRRYAEWRKEYKLARAAAPAQLQLYKPVCEEDYRLRLGQRLGRWLGNLLARRKEYRLAVEEGNEFIATLTVQASRWGGEHHLELMVHPCWRGRLEEMLIRRALAILAEYPNRAVCIKLFASHTEAIEVLSRYGFVEDKTRVILGLDLKPFAV